MKRRHAFGAIVALSGAMALALMCRSPNVSQTAVLPDRLPVLLDPADLSQWTNRIIPSKNPVEYRPAEESGKSFVRATSRNAASFFLRYVTFDAHELPMVQWEWRILRPLDRENLDSKSGNDACARVLFGFKRDWSEAGFFERRAVRDEVSKTGHEPPGTLVVYVRSLEKPLGSVLPEPHLRDRARVIVAGAGKTLGTWQNVRRNLLEDYRLAFGADPPPVVSVAIMTDTDDTEGFAVADYGMIRAAK